MKLSIGKFIGKELAAFKKELNTPVSLPTSTTDGFLNDNNADRFFTLNDPRLGVFMQALWGEYSDSNFIKMYHTMGEVFAPIHQIAKRVAFGVFQLKKLKDNEPVTDNKYINRLLSTPNPLQNFQELVYEWVVYELLTGKNFLYANIPDTLSFDYKNIATLVNLFADQVNIMPYTMYKMLSATNMSDLVKSYNVSTGTGNMEITPDKVLYTKVPSFYAIDKKLNGKSPLLSAQKNICNLLAVYEARNLIYVKGGPSVMITSELSDASGMVSLSPDERKQAELDMQMNYGFGKGKTRIGLSNIPLKVQRVGDSIKDMMPFEETMANALALAYVLGVPQSLLPQEKGSTFNNTNQDEKSMYENVVIPQAQSIAQSLTSFLRLDKIGLYLDVDFSHVKVLQENLKEKAAVDWRNNELCRVRFMSGVISLNDWCVMSGVERSKNPLYDQRLYDMTPEQQAQVITVVSIPIGSNGGALGNNDNDAGN